MDIMKGAEVMNKLAKELFATHNKARMYRFFNLQTGRTVNYKVYDSHRKLIVTTDDYGYAEKTLTERG